MPYYKEANILFIHIPKTGGSELEKELCKKYHQTCRSDQPYNKILPHPYNKNSMQHQFYNTLFMYREKLDIDFAKAKVVAFIRNPYDRVISDLFWFNLINQSDKPERVLEVLKNQYINNENLDNHNQPQFKFISDEHGNLHKNIKLFRCENLNNENVELNEFLGVETNMIRDNVNKDYSAYFNEESRNLIENFYERDFNLLNYDHCREKPKPLERGAEGRSAGGRGAGQHPPRLGHFLRSDRDVVRRNPRPNDRRSAGGRRRRPKRN